MVGRTASVKSISLLFLTQWAAITSNQNKTRTERGVHRYNERVILYCLIMAQRWRLVKIRTKAVQ